MFGRTLLSSLIRATYEGFQGSRTHSLGNFIYGLRSLSFPPGRLRISEEVQSALANGKPVVALETAILTHGLPTPDNLDCAVAVEACIKGQGALPATVGMLDGNLVVGLSPTELARLAEASEKNEALKISRRDVAAGLAKGAAGGTTVSGTMLAANLAGISVFVTGGIGGVHRGGEQTFDISADLTELGRTPVAVVCAGCKSILDIGRTLEYLETQGVPTIVLNNGLSFPAFFVADSGFKGSHSVKTAQEVAQVLNQSISLGINSGLVVGVPIPKEAAAEGKLVEDAIRQALDEAEKASVTGSKITPFVLSRVNELTEGKSLAANLALIKNNAAVGAVVAKELSELRRSSNERTGNNYLPGKYSCRTVFLEESQEGILGAGGLPSDTWLEQESGQLLPIDVVKPAAESGVVVVGAAVSDLVARATDGNIQLNMTNPSTLSRAFGGVGRNVAEATNRFGTQPLFLSAVGDDFIHHDLLRHWRKTLRADSRGIRIVPGKQTSVYVAILHESGELHCGLGSFDVLRDISPKWLDKFQKELVSAKVVCFDGNLSTEVIAHLLNMCGTARVPVWFEPTDTKKAKKPFSSSGWQHISLASPNLFELQSMAKAAAESESYNFPDLLPLSAPSPNVNILDKLQLCKRLSPLLLRHIPWLLVTLGYHGTLLITSQPIAVDQPWLDQLRTRHIPGKQSNAVWIDVLPSKKTQSIVSVSGAGDSLAGAALAGITQGLSILECISSGLWAAQLSLSTVLPVNPEISRDNFSVQYCSSPSDFINIRSGWTDIMTSASDLD